VNVNARIHVDGLVQGVNYRSFTFSNARELGIVGSVENLPDGTVGIECEGEKKLIEQFVALCKRGPSGALIRKVDVAYGKPRGKFKNFSVKF